MVENSCIARQYEFTAETQSAQGFCREKKKEFPQLFYTSYNQILLPSRFGKSLRALCLCGE